MKTSSNLPVSTTSHSIGDGFILVLLPGLPVAPDWVRASAHVTKVVTARFRHPAQVERRTSGKTLSDEHFNIVAIQLRPKRLFWRLNSWVRGRSLVRLIDELEESGRSVVLAHGHFFAGSGGLPYLKAHRGIPYVVSEHSSALTNLNPEKEVSRAGLALARLVFTNAAGVLPVSNYLGSEIRRRGLPGRLSVVPNPVDTTLFQPGELPAEPRIITVTRLARVKRLELLLEAFARVSQVDAGAATLEIVGDGPERDRLVSLARALSIDKNTVFHGYVEHRQVPSFLKRSSVFVSTSHTENLPVAMLEALACGVPVIGPNVAGIPEVIQDAPGELFEPGDVDGLVAALLRWLRPSAEQRSRARKLAIVKYSVPAVGARLAEVYEKAIGSTAPSAKK